MSLPPDTQAVRERAEHLLGPASAAWVASEEGHAAVLEALARGKDLDSGLLGAAKLRGREESAVKQEFLACIMGKMRSMGHGSLSPQMRRFFDTIDIVQSVAGDVFAEGRDPDFEDLGSFLALLRKRLQWKAADHARKLEADKRQEGQRDARDPEELALATESEGPAEANERAEFVAKLQRAVSSLGERDQELVRLYLAGYETREIAGRLGLTQDTAGRVLRRAKDRLKQQFG